jgi:hypothetical protein
LIAAGEGTDGTAFAPHSVMTVSILLAVLIPSTPCSRRPLFVRTTPILFLTMALLSFAACDRRVAERQGGSRDFALEVDEVHDRNQALHEEAQQNSTRLAALEEQAAALRRELAPLSAQWAQDATAKLDAALERARGAVAESTAVTGPEWDSLVRAAGDAVEHLSDICDETRAELEERRAGVDP